MRSNSIEKHNSLVNSARLLATFCDVNKFEGVDILHGLKVSKIIHLYEQSVDGNWLWGMFESMCGKINRKKLNVFLPAIFLLNIQYNFQEDRSEEMMRQCNEQFLRNCILCSKKCYGAIGLARYFSIRLAKKLFSVIEENCKCVWAGKK